MFRLNKNAKTTAPARATLLLSFIVALCFGPAAMAQSESGAKPVGLDNPAAGNGEKATCGHGSGVKRFFFRYSNGDYDSGDWDGPMEIHQGDTNCLTFRNGDTDFDAAEIHLSCSEDYTADPTGVGNGLTVVEWRIIRLGTNGGQCGNIDEIPGELLIAKETIPDGAAGSFDFSGTGGIGAFSLSDDGQEQFFLQPGPYTVTESVPSGWDLDSVVCSDPTGNSSGNAGTGEASIDLASGETVLCTFTNAQVAVPDLRIVKTDSVSSVAEGADFAYTLTVHNDGDTTINSFTVDETVPANTTFNAGGPGGGDWSCADNSPAGTSCSASGGPLAPGGSVQFSFPLTVDELWVPDPVTGICPAEPQDPEVDNTGSVSYTGDGDDATPGNNEDSENTPIDVSCTDNPATLTIIKDTIPDTEGVGFDFTGSSSADGFDAFTLTTGANGSAQRSFTLPGGNYSVDETGIPTGWELLSTSCTGGNTVGSIDLSPGQSVSCTFTNRALGQIVIGKFTNPGGSQQQFEFTRSWSGNNFVLADGGTQGSALLQPGPYTASEIVPDGWALESIVCSDDPDSTGNVGTATANINLDPGETVRCDFTNRELEPGITITKDDGGITVPENSSFAYSLDYENTGELELTDVTLTETVPQNTTFDSANDTAGWNCTGTAPTSTCTLNVGTVPVDGTGSVSFPLIVDELWEPDSETGLCPEEPQNPQVNNTGSIVGDSVNGQADDSDSDSTPIDVECTDNPATLTIVKDTEPDTQGVSFDFTGSSSEDGFDAFTLVTGANGSAQQSFELPGGNYNVSETEPFGWSLTNTSCTGGNTVGSIDLAPGDSVTCTFVNAALNADIAILKLTNGDESNPGQCIGIPVTQTVNWTYQVTNPGEVPIDVQSVVDDNGTPGDTGDDFPPTFTGGDTNGNNLLDTDETWTYSASGTAGDFDPYTNTVTVNGVASDGSTIEAKAAVGDPVSASDESCYEGLTPAIDIVKSDGGITVPENTSFAYSLDYENTGELELTDVTLTETVPQNTTFDSANDTAGWNCTGTAPTSTCTLNVGTVPVDGTGSVSFPLIVDELWEPDSETGLCPEEPQNPQVNNTGSIVGQSDGGQADDSDSDSTPISVACDPNLATLTIVKDTEPDTQGVSFDFTGSSSEDGFNAFTLVTGAGGGASQSFDLPGGNYSVSESGLEPGWELDSTSCTGGNTVGSIDLAPGDSVTCTFVNRSLEAELEVVKSTNGVPGEGEVCQIIEIDDPVNWTYDVSNPGEQPLTIVSIIDDNGTPGDPGDDFTPTLLSDGNGDSVLDPGETWTYDANGTAIAGEYINTVTVTAEVAGAAPSQQAKASPGTLIERSTTSRYCGSRVDLSIEKTDGDISFVAEGGTLVYTLTYENLGTEDLTGVVITETVPVNTEFSAADSTAGWSCADGSPAGTSCTFNVAGTVAAGASGQVQFGLTVLEVWEPDPETGQCPPEPESPLVDNTASIVDDGSNGADADTSNNEASDDTPILANCDEEEQSPDILIEKSPDNQTIQAGATAEFTIRVTNTGLVDLFNVTVTDPLSPDCDRNIGDLAVGAIVVYNCERANVIQGFTNVATVIGETDEETEVTDDDDADVSVLTVDEPEQMHPIPTMSQWGLILMAGLMLMLGVGRARVWTRR